MNFSYESTFLGYKTFSLYFEEDGSTYKKHLISCILSTYIYIMSNSVHNASNCTLVMCFQLSNDLFLQWSCFVRKRRIKPHFVLFSLHTPRKTSLKYKKSTENVLLWCVDSECFMNWIWMNVVSSWHENHFPLPHSIFHESLWMGKYGEIYQS